MKVIVLSHVPPFIVSTEGEKTGESQVSLSRVLPTLHRAACYVHRVQKVARNIMQQMTALYQPEKKTTGTTVDVSDVHFQVRVSFFAGV